MFQSKKNEIVEGYLEFVKQVLEFLDETLEFKFDRFVRMHSTCQVVQAFISFFTWLQIKGFCEAPVETVGSIMKISTSKGKHVEQQNFGKNIALVYNLPPLHVLDQNFIPDIAYDLVKTKKLRFFRKCDTLYPSYVKKLISQNLSASVKNYRTKVEEKMRLPLEMFSKREDKGEPEAE